MTKQPLGKLIAVYGTSPAYLQRAAIVAFTSFFFFLGMLMAFYIRQHFGYFLISTAFLVVFLFTMIGWWMQKRNSLSIYDRGITYHKFTASWQDLESVEASEGGLILTSRLGESIKISPSIAELPNLESCLLGKLTSTKETS